MKKVTKIKELKLIANQIRQDLLTSLCEAKSGHSAGPLGMADIFTVLYFNVANIEPKNATDDKRDRVILSNGHICPVWYATLANAGFFPKQELLTLRKLGTRLQGHPHVSSLPGIENTAGPLGQGTSQAAGIALAAKMDKQKHRIYLLMSDGELQEGQIWEAFMFAAKNKLNNLCAVIDRNNIQIDGTTEDVMPLEPLADKFKAFNWHVIEINGHSMEHIIDAFEEARAVTERPTVIIANTIPGKGVSFMENDYTWHGKPPTKEQLTIALAELQAERKELSDE